MILQFLAIGVKALMPFLPFTFSLVLIPIVIGAAKCGPYMGAWLGFVFGVIVLLSGDAAAFLMINSIGTILTVLIKGTLCGMVPAFIYTALKKYNNLAGAFAAAMAAPIVNTGIFALGCIIIQGDVLAASDRLLNDTLNMGIDLEAMGFMSLLFGVLITANFFIEFAINVVLAPSLNRVTEVITKRINSGSKKKA